MAAPTSSSDTISIGRKEEEEEEISAWRRDPESSFSDWTIRVIQSSDENSDSNTSRGNGDGDSEGDGNNDDHAVSIAVKSNQLDDVSSNSVGSNDGNKEATYHVHRVYLASGPRKSEYFQTLFSLATSTEESASRTTKLVFPESACLAFPQFLDYIYHGGDDGDEMSAFNPQHLWDCPREAAALAFLADYLRVPKLISQTKVIVRNLLNDSNVHVVCREALLYGIDWIIEDCIISAARSPRDLLPSTADRTTIAPSSSSPISSNTSDTTSSRFVLPALQTMEMLPPERQIELLKLSLSHSLRELGRFKRVPSRWKDNIDDVVATHMPTLMMNNNNDNQIGTYNHHHHHHRHRTGDYLLPAQGCGLPFPENKICPLFYFDREPLPQTSSPLPPSQSPQQRRSGISFGTQPTRELNVNGFSFGSR